MATPAKTTPAADEATAAGLRAIRRAFAGLAGQFGYHGTQNEVLVKLGASRQDVETMRQFLAAHAPAADQDDQTT